MDPADYWATKALVALFTFIVPYVLVYTIAHKDLGAAAHVLGLVAGAIVTAAVFGKLTTIIQWTRRR